MGITAPSPLSLLVLLALIGVQAAEAPHAHLLPIMLASVQAFSRGRQRSYRGVRVVSFKLEDDLLEKLEAYARKRGMTRSEVIRRALEKYIEGRPEVKPIITKRIKIYK